MIDWRDDYTTGSLLDYNYFSEYYQMISIDISKQQVLHTDPKAIQRIDFIGNLAPYPNANTTIFFIIEEAKEVVLDFSKGNFRVL